MASSVKLYIDGQLVSATSIPKLPEPLSPERWRKLAICERPLYAGDPGGHAYTDCMRREDSSELTPLWDNAYQNAEGTMSVDTKNTDNFEWEAARRIARAQALIVFGADFLLK